MKKQTQTFPVWKTDVDDTCKELFGQSLFELAECPLQEWFDAGIKPLTAARRIFKAEQKEFFGGKEWTL